MASPPLCIAVFVVNATSSSVTVPPTRQGPCIDSARPGPQKLSPNLPGFGRPARPNNRSKTPQEDLGKRWPWLTSTTAALTKFNEFKHSRWECGLGESRPDVPTRSHFANCFTNGRNRFTEQTVPSPLAWVIGSGIIRPETNAPHWVQMASFVQIFVGCQSNTTLSEEYSREG